MARVTAIRRVTGRVIRRATASPVSSASKEASPAGPAMARSSAVFSTRSAALSPEPVNRTTVVPTRWPRITTAGLDCGPVAVAKAGDASMTWPAWSRIWTAAPVLAVRSRTGERPAEDQVWFPPYAAPAANAIALASSVRCWLARVETSAAANAAVSPASSATAASATVTNARASRRPSALPRVAGPGAAAWSVIAGQAEPVTAAQDGLDDPGIGRIVLDLAAQVLHV